MQTLAWELELIECFYETWTDPSVLKHEIDQGIDGYGYGRYGKLYGWNFNFVTL